MGSKTSTAREEDPLTKLLGECDAKIIHKALAEAKENEEFRLWLVGLISIGYGIHQLKKTDCAKSKL